MTDTNNEVTTTSLRESKYNTLCRSEPILPHLVPLLPVLIATEQEIKESNPREEGNDVSRVFVHYTNTKGNSLLFKVEDHLGFDRVFNIDKFLTGYGLSIEEDLQKLGGDELVSMQFITMSVLGYAISVIFGFEKDRTEGRLKTTCTDVFQSIITCIYDNSKDVMIFCRDGQPREDGEKQVIITNMWSMSKR